MSELKPAAQRVQDGAASQGPGRRRAAHAASTRTAQEAADACGCQVGQIVKSLIFRGAPVGPAATCCWFPALNRVDETVAADQIGEPLEPRRRPVRARQRPGFAIGGIPPLGHDKPLATFIDEALLGHRDVWAAAGTPDAVFPIAPERLAQVVAARRDRRYSPRPGSCSGTAPGCRSSRRSRRAGRRRRARSPPPACGRAASASSLLANMATVEVDCA